LAKFGGHLKGRTEAAPRDLDQGGPHACHLSWAELHPHAVGVQQLDESMAVLS
jgi:hypothetical protein